LENLVYYVLYQLGRREQGEAEKTTRQKVYAVIVVGE
jgi:hypothetical protein